MYLSGLALAQSPRQGLNLLGGLGGWEVLGSFGCFFFVGTMWEVLPVPLALWPHVDAGYLKTAWPDFVGFIF